MRIVFIFLVIAFIIFLYRLIQLKLDKKLQYSVINKPKIISLPNKIKYQNPLQKQIQNIQPTQEMLIENADLLYYKENIRKGRNIIDEYNQRELLYEKIRQPILDYREYRDELYNVYNDNNDHDPIIMYQVLNNYDNQTVHDTTVQNSIKMIHSNLKNKPNVTLNTGESVINEIKEFAKNESTQSNCNIIENVLDKIKNRNSSISNLEDTELGVLKKVWDNGNINVKQQVLNELLECQNTYNDIYCPTGVVTRIINASCIENPESMPRTKIVLREELLNLAAKVRNDLEQDDLFNQKNDEEQKECFKKIFNETLEKEYKDNIGIDNSLIQKELEEWIDYI